MNTAKINDSFGSELIRGVKQSGKMSVHGHFTTLCYDPEGNLKWEESFDNLVTDEGKKFLLDTLFIPGSAGAGALPSANMHFRMSLYTAGTPAANWTYVTPVYTEATSGIVAVRGSPIFSAAGPGITKATTVAVSFAIIGTATILGAAISVLNDTSAGNLGVVADTATANARLYSAGAFGASKSVSSGDTLNVTYSTTLT